MPTETRDDMVERAAKAIWGSWPERALPWEKRREDMRDETRKEAQSALSAALDPEDEVLETAVARAMAPDIFEGLEAAESIQDAYRLSHDAREVRAHARAAIQALRQLALGGGNG